MDEIVHVRTATTQQNMYAAEDKLDQIVSAFVEGTSSDELKAILTVHFPEWYKLFARKNGEYQDGMGTAFVLGTRGQFSDMWRKFMKLKLAMWDDHEDRLATEGVEEIILDLIGHCFLTLEMRRRAEVARVASVMKDVDAKMGVDEKFLDEDYSENKKLQDIARPEPEAMKRFLMVSHNERGIWSDENGGQWVPFMTPADPTVEPPLPIIQALEPEPNEWVSLDDTVRFKQHLGRGPFYQVIGFDPGRDDGQTVLIRDEHGAESWTNPQWLHVQPKITIDEANWIGDDGTRYYCPPEGEYDGTAWCFDGENAGHWIEFGGPTVHKIEDVILPAVDLDGPAKGDRFSGPAGKGL